MVFREGKQAGVNNSYTPCLVEPENIPRLSDGHNNKDYAWLV